MQINKQLDLKPVNNDHTILRDCHVIIIKCLGYHSRVVGVRRLVIVSVAAVSFYGVGWGGQLRGRLTPQHFLKRGMTAGTPLFLKSNN